MIFQSKMYGQVEIKYEVEDRNERLYLWWAVKPDGTEIQAEDFPQKEQLDIYAEIDADALGSLADRVYDEMRDR